MNFPVSPISRSIAAIALFAIAMSLMTSCAPEDSVGVTRITDVQFYEQTPAIEDAIRAAPSTMPSLPDEGWAPKMLPDVMQRPGIFNPLTNTDIAKPWATRWYRFKWTSTVPAEMRLAVYVPRYHPTVGRMTVFVNGVRVDSDERQGWNIPYFAFFPSGLVGSNDQESQIFDIAVALSMVPHGGGAISPFIVGDASELHDRFRTSSFLQITTSQIASAGFLMMGAFAVAFWCIRRNEVVYALFGAIALANFIRSLRYTYSDPMLLDGWYWWLAINASGWLIVSGHFLSSHLSGRHFPRLNRAVIATSLLSSIASLSIPLFGVFPHTVATGAYAVQYLLGIAVIVAMTVGAIQARRVEATMIAAAQFTWFAMSFHDTGMQHSGRDIEGLFLVPYASMFLLATFLLAILRRYFFAIRDAEQLNTSLESRLAERTRQLQDTHAKLRGVEREQAVSDERQRLMREMHDGLGSSLMSSLVLVEQGQLDTKHVAQVLRESIDDLKLTIDSLEPIGHDLPTLLGTLRYRLGRRLESAGLTLQWQVNELPALPWLNPTSALQILRILQEALTNILRHADAKTIRVETAAETDRVWVRISDDGHGFDVNAADTLNSGRGLNNIQRRARSIGAQVGIASSAKGTIVTIDLPREQSA